MNQKLCWDNPGLGIFNVMPKPTYSCQQERKAVNKFFFAHASINFYLFTNWVSV